MDRRTSPGVLGASGVVNVSRPELGETDDPESSSGEKLSDEIDVEGDFDTDSEESDQKASRLPSSEVTGKHKEETENISLRKGIVGDMVRESPSEEQAGKIAVSNITEKIPVEVTELPKQLPELAPSEESKNKGLSNSKSTDDTAQNFPGGRSGMTTNVSNNDKPVVSMSASGLVAEVPSERSTKMTSSDGPVEGQSSEKASEPAANTPVAKSKVKSFEDVFKESIGKLSVNIPRRRTMIKEQEVDTTSSRHKMDCPEDKGREFDSAEASGDLQDLIDVTSSRKELLDQPSCMTESSSKEKSEPAVGSSIDAVASEEETEEIEDTKDIDNFSSDSSSTIIDIELAAKESTEEEIPGNLGKDPPNQTSHQTDKETESGMNEKTEDPSPGPKPSLELKLIDGATGDPKSSVAADQPVTETTSDVAEGNRKPDVEEETEEKQSKETHRESVGHEEVMQNSEHAVDDEQRSSNTGEERPSGSEEHHRRRSSSLDRSELQLETREERRLKPRERSRSDDSQTMLGKKFRISKHGIVLQPGTKLEAMDYSKKWYAAKIVSVDETDQTVLIHFDGWNSRFDEWLEFDSDRLRPLARVSARRETAKEVKAFGGYKVGDEVLARWSDCRYYPAKILGIKTNGSYRVLFYDGIEKTVMGINVRDMPESLKSQHFFSNLEHQFRALVNKKRRNSKDGEGKTKDCRFSKGSTSGSRPSSPVQPATKRRHPSTSQSSTPQPAAKRSRVDEAAKVTKIVTHKGQKIVQTPGPSSPTAVTDQPELLPSPTSSEASELISALEQGMIGGKKRYREPLIFDKNSGLIRDPTRLVAPKELVIDLDHNKYKCDVPDCGKGFRKASLLEYHKKYYHISKPATSTSAMTAAKNAVTRSRKRLSTSAMAPGSSKMRRTESLDRSPAKVTSRPLRTSAPSILTTSHKRPLSSAKLDAPTRPARPQQAQPHKVIRSGQFLKRQSGADPRKHLSTVRTERPTSKPEPAASSSGQHQQQTAATPKDQGPEAATKVTERPRRSSGSSSKEDKPSTIKWEILSTPIKEEKMTSPKVATPPMETRMKDEGPADIPVPDEAALKTVKLEDKAVSDSKEGLGEVLGQDAAGDNVAAAAAAATTDVLKKRRNKPHKKHKRHKTRSRDRRTREQSRSERRRAAERAKQRRQEQKQLMQAASEEPGPRPEDVIAWTAKYLLPNADKTSPHSASHISEDPAAKQDVADSSATDEGGPKEMISCVCRNSEEEGFMIQCEMCFGWQHGGCVGLTEHTVPKRYICSFCIHPENLRTHARHRFNQDWFLTGKLPALVQPKETTEEGTGDQTGSMLKAHQLMADMINVTEALDALQHKLQILKSDNHPDLKLWSYHWGLKDDSAPRNASPRNLQLRRSLEETDLLQTSTDNSALTESLRSDVMVDSITEEVVVEEPCSSSQGKPEMSSSLPENQLGGGQGASDSVIPQGSDRPRGGDGQNGSREAATVLNTGLQDEESQLCTRDPTAIKPEECPMEVDSVNQPVSHSLQSRPQHEEETPVPPDNRGPVASNSSNQAEIEIAPTGKPHLVPDAVKYAVPDQPIEMGTPGHNEKPNSNTKDASVPLAEETTKDGMDAATSDQERPGAPKQDGKTKVAARGCKADGGDSSDDEPLIKYSSKHTSSSVSSGEESKDVPFEESRSAQSMPVPPAMPSPTPPAVPTITPPAVPNATLQVAPKPTPPAVPNATPPAVPSPTPSATPNLTPPPVPSPIPPSVPNQSPSAAPHPTPVTPNQTPSTSTPSDRRPRTASSSAQSVPASVCKLHLFNHIVCVEDELKRRMDYVEDQIEALELAFAQSTGGKEATFITPDPQQMNRTITSLIDDLEKVNKLVSI